MKAIMYIAMQRQSIAMSSSKVDTLIIFKQINSNEGSFVALGILEDPKN